MFYLELLDLDNSHYYGLKTIDNNYNTISVSVCKAGSFIAKHKDLTLSIWDIFKFWHWNILGIEVHLMGVVSGQRA